MTQKKMLGKLRKRAVEVLEKNPRKRKNVSSDDVFSLVNEINLHQIELELQHQDLKDSLKKLEEFNKKYEALCNFIPFGYFTLNSEGTILEANEAAAALLGVKNNLLVNKVLARYIAPNYQPVFFEYREAVLDTMTSQTCEIKFLRKDGPIFSAEVHCKPILSDTGEKQILMFLSDMATKNMTEEHGHMQKNKIAVVEGDNAMCELSSVITHELNQPLAIISNYLSGSIRRLSNSSDMKDVVKALSQASEQTLRLSEIILRMKNFTCKGILKYESTCINEIIKEVVSFIKYELSDYPVEITYYLPSISQEFILDKIHIEQVILNIARNAIESMRDANTPSPRLIIEANLLSAHSVEISITNNGPAIDKQSQSLLYNPYYTTKPYGTGLGLAVSRTIIEAHGGKISIEPNSFGTCFKIILPQRAKETDMETNEQIPLFG